VAVGIDDAEVGHDLPLFGQFGPGMAA
jgi:hypothetical protein